MKNFFCDKMPPMSTHRSLNKLEFKAHMSIHNFVEVPEGEVHESTAFTRDRFGKKHLMTDENGDKRVVGRAKKALILMAALFFLRAGALYANPNTQVSSTDPEIRSVHSWMNQDDAKPPTFYQNGSTSMGFNDDGDPNVSTRF